MIRRLPLLLVFAPAVLAAEDVVVEAESRWITDAAPVFGEYADVDDAGYSLVGRIDAIGRWLDDDAGYWRLWGRGVGLDVYDGALEFGRQGAFDVRLAVSGQEQVQRIDGRSPYRIQGDRFVLPGSWVSGQQTTDFLALPDALGSFRQRRERDRVSLEGTLRFAPEWTLHVAGERELVSGTRAEGGNSYIDASRGYVSMLPVPLDQTVSDLSAALGYVDGRFSSNFSVHFTRFENEVGAIAWELPFTGVLSPAADFPNGVGQLSQAPDHDRLQLRFDASAAPLPGLSVSWDAAWATTDQDDVLLPYTANPALRVQQPVPVDGAGAELETLSLDLRTVYRPQTANRQLRRFTLRAGVHHDDRDQSLVRAPFRYLRGDGADQPAGELALLNTAHDRRRQGAELGVDYRAPFWSSRFSVDASHERIERGNAAVERTETDRYAFTWRAQPLATVSTRLEASVSDRAASTYGWRASFLTRRTVAFVNATPDDQRFDNHPLLRQYHLANAETEGVAGEVGWLLGDAWYLALEADWQRLDHDASVFGLTATEQLRYGIDLQYSPTPDLTAFLWADRTRYDAESAGRAFAGGAEKPANRVTPPLPQGSDPARDWTQRNEDTVVSIGTGFSWTVDERLQLEADYSYVDTRSDNRFSDGGAADLDASPLPDLETRQHSLGATAAWRWRPETTISFRYRFFRFDQEDWGRAGVTPTTLPTVMTLGEDPFGDDVHFLGASVRHSFR